MDDPYREINRLKRYVDKYQKIFKSSRDKDLLFQIFQDLIHGHSKLDLIDKYHLTHEQLDSYLKALNLYLARAYTDKLVQLKDQFLALSHERYNYLIKKLVEILEDDRVKAGTKVRGIQAFNEVIKSQLEFYEKLGVLDNIAADEVDIEEIRRSKIVATLREELKKVLKRKRETDESD